MDDIAASFSRAQHMICMYPMLLHVSIAAIYVSSSYSCMYDPNLAVEGCHGDEVCDVVMNESG